MTKPKEGDVIDGKVVTGVFWPWVKFGKEWGSGWVLFPTYVERPK